MEVPSVYGLLTGCSHVFCLQCLKAWRDPTQASLEVVGSGVHKKCPICRTSSRFVTPSSIFFKSGDRRKEVVINKYKDNLKRIKCRYFENSPPHRRYCPFGRDCFYKHEGLDGKDYVFEHDFTEHEYVGICCCLKFNIAQLILEI
jgi:E3 ubiquitin-protein ligase makorin